MPAGVLLLPLKARSNDVLWNNQSTLTSWPPFPQTYFSLPEMASFLKSGLSKLFLDFVFNKLWMKIFIYLSADIFLHFEVFTLILF